MELLPFDETRRRLRVCWGAATWACARFPSSGSSARSIAKAARERGADFIDANTTLLVTNYEVPPGVDFSQLVHTEQQRLLLEETGLGRARPDAVIEFTILDGYAQLSDIIKAHGYDLVRQRGAVLSPEEVAGDARETDRCRSAAIEVGIWAS
jgi:hypothetical protein